MLCVHVLCRVWMSRPKLAGAYTKVHLVFLPSWNPQKEVELTTYF